MTITMQTTDTFLLLWPWP